MTQKLIVILCAFFVTASVAKTDTGPAQASKISGLKRSGSRLPTKEQATARHQKRILNSKFKEAIERPMKAAKAKSKRDMLEKYRRSAEPGFQMTEKDRFEHAMRKSSRWGRFAQQGHWPSGWTGADSRGPEDGPILLVNGASSAVIEAKETFKFSITFSSGKDSALVDLFFDADGDTVVGTVDVSLFSILFPGEADFSPEAPFWIYDNSREDENPAEGEFSVTIDDFPYMGMSVIFQATDGGGTSQAYLTVNNLTGDYTATGTVSPITAPALVFFAHEWEDEPFMTFTDAAGSFSFDFLNPGGGFSLGAMDVVLGLNTDEYLLSAMFLEDPDELAGVTIDITRDAAITGAVVDAEDGSGIEQAWITAYSGFFVQFVIGYSLSDADGAFSLPLQSGHMYEDVGAYHPDYLGDLCLDYPVYVSEGDTVDVTCELRPWPAFVEGYVTDAETGDPIEDIFVQLWMWGNDRPVEPPMMGPHQGHGDDMNEAWNSALTDENGYYRMGAVLGEGEICSYDWGEREYQGFCDWEFVVDEVLERYDMELHPFDGAISGVVTDASTTDPLPGADVWAYSGGWDFGQWDMTDDEGRYELPVVNGTYTVCADNWREGYEETCVENILVQDNVVTQDIALEPPDGYIQGHVYDEVSGEPVRGIGVDAYRDYYYHYTETDVDGFFKMGVNNGTYEICFYDWRNTYEDTCITSVTVMDDVQEISMYLSPIEWDGAMAGHVSDDYGNPVVAWVGAIDTVAWGGNFTMTDWDGEYLLPLNNGTYIAGAEPFAWGYLWDIQYDVTVNLDTVDVDFVTPVVKIDAAIHGTVVDTSSNPLKGAWIEADTWSEFAMGPWGGDLHFDTESDETGSYELDVMAFDDRHYWIYADWWDSETDIFWVGGKDSVSVKTGDSVLVDLVLRPIVYSSGICGYVTMDGEPMAGVEVSADNYETGEYFSTTTDENGYFCMGVFSGEYDICTNLEDPNMMMCGYLAVWDEEGSMDFAFGTVAVDQKFALPESFTLYQNQPNPFNPVTAIRYDLPEEATVQLTVYDILGHEVVTLVNSQQVPGYHSIPWDGRDYSGRDVATGVYIYRIKAGEFTATKKLILLR